MKYLADDGAVFESEQECSRYEQDLKRDEQLYAECARFLDMQDWAGDERAQKRERTKAETWIRRWLAYDARQRPERYEEEVDEVAVNIVTGAA